MKNILAENLLRFGVKNLKDSDKEKLTKSRLSEYVQPGDLSKHKDVLAFSAILQKAYIQAKTEPQTVNETTYEYAGEDLYLITRRSTDAERGAVRNNRYIYAYTIGASTSGMPAMTAVPAMLYWQLDNYNKVKLEVRHDSTWKVLPSTLILLNNSAASTYGTDETATNWKNYNSYMNEMATPTVGEFCKKFASKNANMFAGKYAKDKATIDANKPTSGIIKYLQYIFDALASSSTSSAATTPPVKKQ